MPVKPTIFLDIASAAQGRMWSVLHEVYGTELVYQFPPQPQGTYDIHLRDVIAARGKRYRVIGGSFIFETENVTDLGCRHFTLLADPVSRALANYWQIRRTDEYHLHEVVVQQRMQDGIEAVRRNPQTRIFSGAFEEKDLTEVHLERAKHNLENHFAVVGICERFDETLLLLKREFGWKTPYYEAQDDSPVADVETPELVRNRIIERNTLDIELYNFALHRFSERVAALGLRFQREVFVFRQTLPLWRAWHSARTRLDL